MFNGRSVKLSSIFVIIFNYALSNLFVLIYCKSTICYVYDLFSWVFRLYYKDAFTDRDTTKELFEAIAGYGLGGSCIGLFGRVGGGIYSKAADVGKPTSFELCGKSNNHNFEVQILLVRIKQICQKTTQGTQLSLLTTLVTQNHIECL